MRLTISLDETMVSKLLGSTHLKNKSKAVRIAVSEFLRKDRLKRIEALRGHVDFDEDVLKARHAER